MRKKRPEKPFGEIALQKNYITLKQLIQALNTQHMNKKETGDYRLIGTILYEQGAIDMNQFSEVLNHRWFIRVNEIS